MGIRPDRMQALAWALAAGATGIAGALIATFFYISPTVGETLAIVAFVTVALGGFGSVPGALVAGLLIGVIEALSAYLDRRRLQGHRSLFAVRRRALAAAAGPDGQVVMQRALIARLLGGLPAGLSRSLFTTPFQQRLGALVLLYAIARLRVEYRRRLRRPGLGRPRGLLRVRRLRRARGLSPLRAAAARRRPGRDRGERAIAAVIGVPTLRLSGHYFSHGDDRGRRARAARRHQHGSVLGAAVGLSGPTVPRTVLDLSFTSAVPYYYLFLAVLALTARIYLEDGAQPHGLLPARHQGQRAGGPLASASRPAATSSMPSC